MSSLRLLDPAFSDNFETALRRFFAPVALDTDTPVLKMRIDVAEKDNAYEVKADIPGVNDVGPIVQDDPIFAQDVVEFAGQPLFAVAALDVNKEDINVRIDGNVVQIDAEVKREKETKGNGDKVLRSERYYGIVSRTFSLADDVDDSKAEAKYADGVLTLQLPKKTTAASRKVTVQ